MAGPTAAEKNSVSGREAQTCWSVASEGTRAYLQSKARLKWRSHDRPPANESELTTQKKAVPLTPGERISQPISLNGGVRL